MNDTYDVVVVGAGPAGCMTAKTCAEKGLDVIMLEKDAEIGTPKRCAEGLSLHGFERAGIKHNKKYIARAIEGAYIYSPSGKEVEIRSKGPLGYVLERKIWEKYLARDAIKAGSDCMVKTTVNGLLSKNGKITGVKGNAMGDNIKLNSKVVAACDGVESKVGRMCGLKTTNKITDCISGYQYEMAGIENLDMNMLHMFFGSKTVPRGYLWVFPKDKDIGNVGIGILGTENAKKTAKAYLDDFIASRPEIFGNAAPIEVNAGSVPVSGYVNDAFVKDGLALIGDSAQMVNPIHGGGMTTNLYAAQIAGRVISEAVRDDDTSAAKLSEYEKEWRDTDGKRMHKLLKLRYFMEKLTDEDMELLADILNGENLLEMQEGKTSFLLKKLIRHPKLLNIARKYLI